MRLDPKCPALHHLQCSMVKSLDYSLKNYALGNIEFRPVVTDELEEDDMLLTESAAPNADNICKYHVKHDLC